MVKGPCSSDNGKQTGGVTIGDIIGGIHNSIIAGRDIIIYAVTGSTAEQRAQRNQRAMLELVKDFWIKGVLEQSLHGAAMIELGLEERAGAIECPWDMVLQTPDQPNRPLPRGTKIVDVFAEMNRALLILGEPGSGKTTMLLELARDTIACAKGDPAQPIPVVFNLSSWAEKRQPIAEWLVEELNTKYRIPKRIARPWVENDDLLLLLDGLDEVTAKHRGACVEAINEFREEHGLAPIVVCSRVADYEALTTRLELQGAVLLQPLTPQQIDQYLEGAGTELLAVRRTLEHDPTFQELAQTPLMLSVMTLAYREMSVEDLGTFDSIEARRRHVLDTYVRRMFERRGADHSYSLQETVRWLAWLAQRMKRRGQTILLIESIQPSWLHTRTQKELYDFNFFLAASLFFGLLGALVGGLLVGLSEGLPAGLASAPGLGLLAAAGGGWIGWWFNRQERRIKPAEALRWSWGKAARGFRSGLGLAILPAMLLGPFITLLVVELGDVPIDDPTVAMLVGTAAILLVSGLVGAWSLALSRGLEHAEIETKTRPNQGIWKSAKNAVSFGLVCGLASCPVGALAIGLAGWLVRGAPTEVTDSAVDMLVRSLSGGLFVGLVVGPFYGLVWGGGFAFIQHFALRSTLCKIGYLPWNLTRFLDYAVERIFLREVGGGYMFVHRLLLEYFAMLGEDAESCLSQGIACFDDGNLGQAILYFTRAIELDPSNADFYVHRGKAYVGDENFWKAIDDFSQAIELAPDNAEIHLQRGDVYYDQGDYERAIDDYTNAISVVPDSAKGYGRRADACYESGSFKQAIADYTRAIGLAPNDARFHLSRGDAYAHSGNSERALMDCTGATELDPGNPECWNSLCWFASLSGHAADVMQACEQAVALDPDNGAFHDSRGLARALTGDREGAIEDFRFFVEWSKENNQYERYGPKRETWIAKLEAGRNPFDEATLEELLQE